MRSKNWDGRLTLQERFHEVFAASQEARRPLLYGQLIIMVVYLPIFALTGVEGRMFTPMALTVVIALLGAMMLSITFIPAAVALFIGDKVAEKENAIMRAAKRWYAPLLDKVMRNTPVVLTGAAVAVRAVGLAGHAHGQRIRAQPERGRHRHPGPAHSRHQPDAIAGHAAAAGKQADGKPQGNRARVCPHGNGRDRVGPHAAEHFRRLHHAQAPRRSGRSRAKSREQLLAEIEATATSLPGNNYEFSQPIQLRFNELISGVRSDVAVKLFGDDMAVLDSTAAKIAGVLGKIPGATEVKVEQTTGLPMLTVQIDREQTARYGLNIADVQAAIATAIGGQEAGTLFQGDRRFDIVVRLPDSLRSDLEQLKRLPIALPVGAAAEGRARFIPLGEVASLQVAPGPNQISREDGKRRIVVSANVRGRDIGSFVAEATQQLQSQVAIPAGYWTSWGGQFEQLQSATKRLELVVPVALALVFVLLFAMFGNVKDGLLVFSGIPFALTGGIVALWLRDIPMSISAAVGFIALSGVAVLNGLVMIAYIRQLREQGMPLAGGDT